MRTGAFTAIFFGLMAVAAVPAQGQNQKPAPNSSMDGMDMSKPADSGQAPATGKPMNGACMMGSGKPMDVGNGSGSKAMDMGHCMGMMHGSAMNATPIPPGVLRIALADKSTDWTPAKLAALPHTTVTVSNEHTKASETYGGVLLIDLLTPLGVAEKPNGKDLRLFVVAVGSDGYEVVYSIGEVTPSLNNSTVIVADTENGKPLTDDGPLKMIATGEKHPARWVRNLVAIRVLAAE
jgi:hypothetical protein